jgi:hypothetical protein
VVRCDFPDCDNQVTMASGTGPLSVAVDESSLYFAQNEFNGWVGAVPAISRCPLAGCGTDPPTAVQSGDISPYAIALDDERLYYTNVDHGTVVSVPK